MIFIAFKLNGSILGGERENYAEKFWTEAAGVQIAPDSSYMNGNKEQTATTIWTAAS